MRRLISLFTLFTSGTTLICCALPALLVSLGLGAALAGVISGAPWITWFSEHKEIVFGAAAAMLLLSGVLVWRARNAPCPIEPKLARACTTSRRWSLLVWIASLCCFVTGIFFAFIAPWLW